MSDDERPDSLAAQAASWVPPWERQPRPPDRAYQAAAEQAARAEAEQAKDLSDAGEDTLAVADEDFAVADEEAHADAREEGLVDADDGDFDDAEEETGLAADDDDFNPAFEGPDPAGYGDGDDDQETAAVAGVGREVLGVDSPSVVGDEPEPTLGELGPELPVPDAIEEAAVDDVEDGVPADLPIPLDGDDAGDVFDAAADDDMGDDDVDLAASELAPPDDETADDETAGDETADDETAGGETAAADPVSGDEGVGDGDAAQPPASPAAGSIGDRGRAKAGLAVPEQGRRRRDGADSVGDGWARTPDEAQADAERDVAIPERPAASPEAAASIAKAQADAARGRPGADAQADAARGRPEMSGKADAVGEAGNAEKSASDGAGAEAELPALVEDAELAAALEAILLVVDEPVAEMQLAQILEQPTERVGVMLEDLSARYTAAGHGFDLRRAAGGWRLYTRPEYAAYVERFVLDGQSVRLTQAALETLAVVAYKQPVTRSRISAIRGVNCDGVMRTLVTRGLIEECGTEGETGAYLYRTTALFLEKLGLNSVDQLPPLAPFLPDDVEEVLDASG